MSLTGFNSSKYIETEFANLSVQQQQMVNAKNGAILAEVEPGSNTLKILALRTARLLSQEYALPENVICFTTNDASARALKQQLYLLVGDAANKVQVTNFKAFAEKILQDNISKTESGQPLPVSILETVHLLKELIDALPKNNALKRFRRDVYKEIANLKRVFSFIKTTGCTIEFLHEQIEKLLAELKSGNQQFFEVLHTLPAADEEHQIKKLRAAIDEFDNYQNGLLNHNRYDEDDYIRLVTEAFEEDPQLLSTYREKFKYILVDGSVLDNQQSNKLLKQLLGKDQQPNVFVIHANNGGFNLSSGIQELLGKELFSGWTEIKADTANFQAGIKEFARLSVVHSYPSTNEEFADIINKVANLLQQNIPPASIAIICPAREYIEELGWHLNQKNIPFYSKLTVDILKHPFTKKIIQLLHYISLEKEIPYSGDELLFEILHVDFFQVPPIEIAQLSVEVNSKKYSSNPTAIRKLLQERANAPAKDLFDTGLDKSLKRVNEIVERLIRLASTISLRQLYNNTIDTVLVKDYIERSVDGILLNQLLNSFSDFIKNETDRNPTLTLNELMASIDTMQSEGLPIYAYIEKGESHSVQLISAAEAGFQQFDYLFIPGANALPDKKKIWLDIIYRLPETNLEEPNNKQSHNLMKAILTNKNAHLFISFSRFNKNGKALEPTAFVTTILTNKLVPVNEIQSDDEVYFPVADQTKLLPKIAPLNEAFIKPIVNKFVMNVSALNSYLNCPLGFYYKNILRVPDGQNEALQFGSAIHYALEQLFKKMAAGFSAPANSFPGIAIKEQFPSATEMIADFKLYLFNHRSNFTKAAFDRRIIYGEEVLQNYYNQYLNTWNKVVSIERNMRGITVNGVPLKGKLDKLEFNGKEVTIVDYKSGDVEKALTKINPPNDEEPNGGDYWRQAVFYKLLIDNYTQKEWKVVSTEFDFIEPDKTGAFRKVNIAISNADIETVKQQLTLTWQKIKQHEFYTGCGKPGCHWCNFVRDNNLSATR